MIFLSPFQSYEHICQTPPMNFTKNFCILCNVNYLRGRNDNRNDSVEKQIYLSFGSKANSLQERYKLFSFCLGRDKGISHLNPSYSMSTVKCCHILIIFFFFFFCGIWLYWAPYATHLGTFILIVLACLYFCPSLSFLLIITIQKKLFLVPNFMSNNYQKQP